MRNVILTLKSSLQYALGAGVVVAVVILVITMTTQKRIAALPPGWSIVSAPGEVSALLVNGNEIWAGGRDGLTVIDAETHAVLPTPPQARQLRYIRALQRGDSDEIWIAHNTGISVHSNGNWRHILSDDLGLSGAVFAVLPDGKGGIWVGGEGGLVHGTRGIFRPVSVPANMVLAAVSTLFHDSEGRLWVGSDSHINGGLVSVDRSRNWQAYAVGRELHHASITGIIEDRNGAIWITTGFAGHGAVSLFHDGKWARLTRDGALAGRKVRAIYEDTDERIWLGYEYDGLSIRTATGWHDITYEDGLAGEEVKAIIQDQTGAYWIATPQGLSVIERGAWR